MRILIVTAGSRGDVAPFTGLGQRLEQAGHQVALAAHHAGAGTTGAGLRAGVPAIPVPVLVDQPFWAARLHRLGVAPHPLPIHELTADTLTVALRSCLDQPTYRHRATELARRVRADDGPAAVLSPMAQLADERPAS